jgi:hypothetical protein
MTRARRLVYVSGAPGAGKTSLAGPLAAALGYALLAKDTIKEALHDALGAPETDRAWSRRLGGASMELLWTLAARAPEVVLEANFRPPGPSGTARSASARSSPSTRPSRWTWRPWPRGSARITPGADSALRASCCYPEWCRAARPAGAALYS